MQTSAEAEADDIATIAAMKGWSIAEAERRLRDEEPFTELAAELWRRYPTTFSGAWTDHDHRLLVEELDLLAARDDLLRKLGAI